MEWLSSIPYIGPVLHFLIVLVEAIMVLNLMILVHEWGHFLAARWRGLKVEKFYIWFGKPIWKRVYNGVEYGLGSIPLGGYVQLPQMGPMGGIEGEEEAVEKLPPVSPLDKIIVAFAGPLFSFLLAVVFAWMVYWTGMPDRRVHTTTIGWIDAKLPAAKAGFKPGDKIIAIDGVEVMSWDEPVNSVIERIAFSKGDTIEFTVVRPGVEKPLNISTKFEVKPGSWFERRGLRRVGLASSSTTRIEEVLKNSAADRVGLKKGDIVTALNGEKLYTSLALLSFFENEKNAAATVTLTVQRDGKEQELKLTGLTPDKPKEVPENARGIVLTGLIFGDSDEEIASRIIKPLPGESIKKAGMMMARTLGAITGTRGDVGIQQMGGPVKIVSIYSQLFTQPGGWQLVLWFSVILNVNLALMNLLPFPVFDGGHIVMGILEIIRRGATLPVKFLERLQAACVLTLICFFVYVTWFDANDLVSKDKNKDFKLEDVVYPAK